jgi:hypothetical protein
LPDNPWKVLVMAGIGTAVSTIYNEIFASIMISFIGIVTRLWAVIDE